MIDLAKARLALHNWVKTELEIEAIWEDQGYPRPQLPYASLKIISGPIRAGTDELRQVSSGVFSVAGLRRIVVSVQVYGEDALLKGSALQTSLSKHSTSASLNAGGLALIRATDVKDVTVALDNRFESRAHLDAEFYLAENEVDDPGLIEKVEVTNEVDGSTSTVQV